MRKLKKAGLLLSVLSILSGCSDPKTPSVVPFGGNVVEGEELFCICESEEKAREIADLYEIELVRWGNRVAVFHTKKKPGNSDSIWNRSRSASSGTQQK